MKVLHLPYNIASFLTIAVKSLNKLEDVEARGLVLADPSKLHDYDGVKLIPWMDEQRYSLKWFINSIKRYYFFLKWVLWADIVHWYWDDKVLSNGLALKVIQWTKKPALVEFLGSEIRMPKIEFDGNPYCEKHFEEVYNMSPSEQEIKSVELQQKFGNAGFDIVACPEMEQFIIPGSFKMVHSLFQRIIVEDYEPVYPKINNTRPLIVHAPSKPMVKGTPHILDVINKLKKDRKYNFNFQLITGMSHFEAIKAIKQCDIYIDHMGNAGSGYGMAAIEAMSYGKPVLGFVRPKLLDKLPQSFPLINTSAESLYENLIPLLVSARKRNKLGIEGRQYVERYHDTAILSKELVKIYEKVIKSKH